MARLEADLTTAEAQKQEAQKGRQESNADTSLEKAFRVRKGFPRWRMFLFHLEAFVGDECHLSFACVDRDWRQAWKKTYPLAQGARFVRRPSTCYTTASTSACVRNVSTFVRQSLYLTGRICSRTQSCLHATTKQWESPHRYPLFRQSRFIGNDCTNRHLEARGRSIFVYNSNN